MASTMRKRAKILLECPFCHKTSRGKTTQEARMKRMKHVIEAHGQMSDDNVEQDDLEKMADFLAPEEPGDLPTFKAEN